MSAVGEVGLSVWLCMAFIALMVPEVRQAMRMMWKYRKEILIELQKDLESRRKNRASN